MSRYYEPNLNEAWWAYGPIEDNLKYIDRIKQSKSDDYYDEYRQHEIDNDLSNDFYVIKEMK
jgi:hypothetical protein